MTNINDKVRAWQNLLDDGCDAATAQRVAQEAVAQLQHHLRHPAEVKGDPDVLARQMAALTGTLEEHRRSKRKRVDVEVLRDILKMQ